MNTILLLLALPGHAFLWIGLVNRLHALGWRRRIIGRLTLLFLACTAVIPLAIGAWHVCNTITIGINCHPERSEGSPCVNTRSFAALRMTVIDSPSLNANVNAVIAAYLVLCWIITSATLLRLVWLRLFLLRTPPCVRLCRRRRAEIDLDSAAARGEILANHWLARLPLNEILRLDLVDWTLDLTRLPPALDGLSIVHLSDLHFTGRVGKAYFREVVRVCNELAPDVTVVTGDLIDKADCMAWIPDALGRLSARHGVYFILGNHDLRAGRAAEIRRQMEQCGFVDLGGRTRRIEIAGQCVELLGNERPWIEHAPQLPADGFASSEPALRIALAHSPDQLAWAKSQRADLLFAGHTHGGQIRIPPLGAIFSPTMHGVKYISGVFDSPPTILHVTRGISGDIPVRWRCPPEIARLTLRSLYHS